MPNRGFADRINGTCAWIYAGVFVTCWVRIFAPLLLKRRRTVRRARSCAEGEPVVVLYASKSISFSLFEPIAYL